MAVPGRPTKIGKYDVVEILGEGGMGAVYKAVDPRIGRTVAIKVIKGDFAQDPELRRRFDTEARAVGNLQHPNIVTVFDFGEEHGSPFLVMQFLDGTPLDKVIAQRQNLPFIQKLDIIIGVLRALDYAHEHGVIHRDVKPANVHVLKDGSVKLLDFGIAREGNLGQTKTGQIMGTMFYMPPEQMNGETVDRRGDIFSTGIMLFELLTYSLPFDARDQTAIIVQRLKGDPAPPLSKYFENYPLELDEIIARAMMRDRDERYSRAEDFAFDLQRVQERLKRDMASHYVDQARALIAKSDLAKAREILSQVLKIDTQNSTAKQLFYEVQSSLQKAQKVERVQQIRIQAQDALSSKKLDEAADLVEQAIRMDQSDPDLLELRELVQEAKTRAAQVKKLLNLANVALQSEQFEVAQKAVTDALGLDPADTDARVTRAAIERRLGEYEKRNRVQQLLQASRREVTNKQFDAARDNINQAKAIDPTHPEIPGLEKMLAAGLDQEKRRTELQQACAEIERRLVDHNLTAARDLAASALRKFPGEEKLIRLKAAADDAYEQQERRKSIDENIASASRLLENGQAGSALKLLHDAERQYPTDTRLQEYIRVVREAAAHESAEHERKGALLLARAALRRKSFAEAIDALERAQTQFPEDAEIRELLESARSDLDQLAQKKQVEDVSKQARELLEAKAHTDAINLLERTAAQVTDPDLVRLLEHARREAANFRTGVRNVTSEATQMVNAGRTTDALNFLETQVPTYGKSAEFRGLLEQTRRHVEDVHAARRRVLREVEEARSLILREDLQGADDILRICQAEAPSEPEIMALAIEVAEAKKTLELRRAAEMKRAREAQTPRPQPSTEPAVDSEAPTKFFREGAESQRPHPGVDMPPFGGVSPSAPGSSGQSPSPTNRFPTSATPLQTVPPALEPPVLPGRETVQPKKKAGKQREQGEKETAGRRNARSEAIGTVPSSEITEEELIPPAPAPGKSKTPLLIGLAAVLVIVGAVVAWLLVSHPTPPKLAYLKVMNAPSGAAVEIDDKPVSTGADGLYKVAPGTHSVRISAPGYESKPPSSVTVEADKTETVDGTLVSTEQPKPPPPPQPQPKEVPLGTVTVAGNTDGVEIYTEAGYQGRTGRDSRKQLSLTEGSHIIHFKKTGFKDLEKRVEVVAKKDKSLPFEMIMEAGPPKAPPPPTDADLTIHTRPGTALHVGGQSSTAGAGGSATFKLPPGTYDIQASQTGFEDYTEKVTLKAGDSISRNLSLNPKPKPAPIISFDIEPKTIEEGQSAIARWEVQNATDVVIEGIGAVSANDKRNVSPTKTTTYKLIARWDGGTKSEERTLNVNPKPVVVVHSPPEQPKENPPSAVPSGDGQALRDPLRETLDQYEDCFSKKDIACIQRMWPGIPVAVLSAYKGQFSASSLVVVKERCPGSPMPLSPDTAAWTCNESRLTRGSNGENQSTPDVPRKFTFKKKGGGWVIDSRN